MKHQLKFLLCVVDVLVYHVITRLGARGRTPSTKPLIGVCLAVLLLGMITGCTKEQCVVCPPDQPPAEKDFHFIYAYGGADYWVYTYSTKSCAMVDSVRYGTFPFSDLRFSRDGRYAYYTNPSAGVSGYYATWVTDYATGDTLKIDYGHGGHSLSLSQDEKYLMASESRELAIYRLPELELVYTSGGVLVGYAGFNAKRNIAYVPVRNEDSLLIVNLSDTGITTRKIELKTSRDTEVSARTARTSLDGSLVFLGLFDRSGASYLQVRDPDDLHLLREFRNGPNGPVFHPDGRRVFLVDVSDSENGGQSSVYCLDLSSMVMVKILDCASLFFPGPSSTGLLVYYIEITPDGRYAFLTSGPPTMPFGPILKLDLDSYQIVAAAYPPPRHTHVFRMYPIEIKGGGSNAN